MVYLNINRARESDEHRRMKDEARTILLDAGYLAVFPEWKCCDLIAVRSVEASVAALGVELERSSRNVVHNARRNFRNGCDCVLILASSKAVYDSCVRVLKKNLTEELTDNTYINTFPQFRDSKKAFQLSSAPLYSANEGSLFAESSLYSAEKMGCFAEHPLYSLPLEVESITRDTKA